MLSGPVVKRPGTNYIGEAKDPTAVFVPFFKDKDNTYIIELGILIETVTSSITSGDATVTVSDTSRLSINQPVTGTGIPAGATIASITDSTDFELSVTASATNGSASLSISIGYLRVWSQNQLLKERTGSPGTTHATNIYETASSVPWTSAQLETLKFTQSGDIIFVCCPDKKPHRIFRTLVTSGTRAADDSFWTVDEFVMTDGPYKSINIWSEDDAAKKFSLKLVSEPGVQSDPVGTVEFNTVDDSLVLANHGLQTGQK